MKKSLFLALSLLLTLSAYSQGGKWTIKGVITGKYNADRVYLVEEEFINGPQTVLDSCMLDNGGFTFTGTTPEFVKMYFIKSADPDSRTSLTPVFLEDGSIYIQANGDQFTQAKVRGTINNNIMGMYFLRERFITDSMMVATDIDWLIHGREDMERESREFHRRGKHIEQRWLDIQDDLVRTYNDKAFAPFMIYWNMRRDVTLDQLKDLRAQLDPSLNNHPYTKAIEDYITSSEFKEGNEMPYFTLTDDSGNERKWTEFLGKYVLIDFWASWCGPCIREMPNIVKLYEECKGDNFEIVGISLDKDKDKWLAAVEKFKMEWPQLCDFLVWDTKVAQLCKVDAVPYTILVDPEGKVVAINLRGEELIAKVKELLGK